MNRTNRANFDGPAFTNEDSVVKIPEMGDTEGKNYRLFLVEFTA